MMRNWSLAIICAITGISVSAQINVSRPESPKDSFEEFRKGILEEHNQFRRSILEDYDRFLEAAWEDYQQMKGLSRYETPKPKVVPTVPEDQSLKPDSTDIPKPKKKEKEKRPKVKPVVKPVKPKIPVIKPKRETKPDSIVTPKEELPKPVAEPVKPVEEPVTIPEPAKPVEEPVKPVVEPVKIEDEPVKPAEDLNAFKFPFYAMEMKITDKAVKIGKKLASPNDFAGQWRSLSKEKAEDMVPELNRIANEHGLNDYLTFRLVRSFVNARYPEAHSTAKVALEHYLLCNMGYDVRLALDDNSIPLLMIPFNQGIYARPFLTIGGKKYFIYEPDGVTTQPNARIMTCKIPTGTDAGKTMDLRIEALQLPEKPHDFTLSFGDITLTGQVNENLMNVVYNYPQMPVVDFALSQLSPDFRASLVEQLKHQLDGMEEQEAVDKLLQFTQSAFDYATDQELHGFEKPYFLEEILYYPKCDCEDRSIFYTYMLWNVLGVENHLLGYPGHESASVHLSTPVKGNSYEWEGKTFYISDPTFVGSKTGMCMPVYRNVKPEIEHEYK